MELRFIRKPYFVVLLLALLPEACCLVVRPSFQVASLQSNTVPLGFANTLIIVQTDGTIFANSNCQSNQPKTNRTIEANGVTVAVAEKGNWTFASGRTEWVLRASVLDPSPGCVIDFSIEVFYNLTCTKYPYWDGQGCITPTASPTPSSSATVTPGSTRTLSSTSTPTPTSSLTKVPTTTSSRTPSTSPSITPTRQYTVTPTGTASTSSTRTATATPLPTAVQMVVSAIGGCYGKECFTSTRITITGLNFLPGVVVLFNRPGAAVTPTCVNVKYFNSTHIECTLQAPPDIPTQSWDLEVHLQSLAPSFASTPVLVVLHPCDPNPCHNGGNCSAVALPSREFTCACPPTYTGTLCKRLVVGTEVSTVLVAAASAAAVPAFAASGGAVAASGSASLLAIIYLLGQIQFIALFADIYCAPGSYRAFAESFSWAMFSFLQTPKRSLDRTARFAERIRVAAALAILLFLYFCVRGVVQLLKRRPPGKALELLRGVRDKLLCISLMVAILQVTPITQSAVRGMTGDYTKNAWPFFCILGFLSCFGFALGLSLFIHSRFPDGPAYFVWRGHLTMKRLERGHSVCRQTLTRLFSAKVFGYWKAHESFEQSFGFLYLDSNGSAHWHQTLEVWRLFFMATISGFPTEDDPSMCRVQLVGMACVTIIFAIYFVKKMPMNCACDNTIFSLLYVQQAVLLFLMVLTVYHVLEADRISNGLVYMTAITTVFVLLKSIRMAAKAVSVAWRERKAAKSAALVEDATWDVELEPPQADSNASFGSRMLQPFLDPELKTERTEETTGQQL
eukprot:TRINITY_DN66957_c0_g1_i1.p1 TRINITY_DN66957_c0_g1~~TRINITY_DN66957_c0_g1_i1.p1  ORF type:complete len:804 (-),score=103.30 TRINITY_DN66957_c0_g1_i1:34-2409(-)